MTRTHQSVAAIAPAVGLLCASAASYASPVCASRLPARPWSPVERLRHAVSHPWRPAAVTRFHVVC